MRLVGCMLKFLEQHQFEAGDRIFEPLHQFMILNSALAYATNAINFPEGPMSQGASCTIGCNLLPFSVLLPLYGPLEAAIAGKRVTGTKIGFVEAVDRTDGVHTNGLATAIGSVAASVFTNFYESHAPLISRHISPEKHEWPELFRFGTIVRNSLAHGWRIKIQNQNAPSATWHGQTYGYADNDRTTINGDLGTGDVLVLIKEWCEELDRLGIPLPS